MEPRNYIVGLALLLMLQAKELCAQSPAVGINTTNPNRNAVMDLVSPEGNQGFLVPRLSTAQRLAMVLGDNDNGLLVFDADQNQFFYWANHTWNPLRNQPVTPTVELPTDLMDVDDADADPFNEIQNLELVGSQLRITNNPEATPIDLKPFTGNNTDEQDLLFTDGVISLAGDPDNTKIDLNAYASGSDALTIRGNPVDQANPSDGDVLIWDGEASEWKLKNVTRSLPVNLSAFKATGNKKQKVKKGGITLEFDPLFDLGNNFDADNSRFIAPSAGIYHFEAVVTFYDIDKKDEITLELRVNDEPVARAILYSTDKKFDSAMTISSYVELTVDDEVTVYAFGDTNDTSDEAAEVYFAGRKVH